MRLHQHLPLACGCNGGMQRIMEFLVKQPMRLCGGNNYETYAKSDLKHAYATADVYVFVATMRSVQHNSLFSNSLQGQRILGFKSMDTLLIREFYLCKGLRERKERGMGVESRVMSSTGGLGCYKDDSLKRRLQVSHLTWAVLMMSGHDGGAGVQQIHR